MQIPFSPFIIRSLRSGCRKGTTYLLRSAVLAFLLIALLSAHVQAQFTGAPGNTLLGAIAYLNAMLITLSGPFFFASMITEEKEHVTLGYLKIACLSPFSILFGKGTSQLLLAVMLLVAQLPFVVLAVTLGGVSLAQVWACYLALLAYLVFVANLSLLCSVLCKRTTGSQFLTAVFLCAFLFGPLVTGFALGILKSENVVPAGGAIDRMAEAAINGTLAASVFGRLQDIMMTGFSGPLLEAQFLSNLGLGAVCFLLGLAAFESCTREAVPVGPARPVSAKRRRLFGWMAPGRTWQRAVIWKDFYFLCDGVKGWVWKFIAFGSLIMMMVATIKLVDPLAPVHKAFSGAAIGISLALGGLEIVIHSGRIFAQEWRWQTLSALMILPVSTMRVAYSKAAGLLLGLVPALAWLILGFLANPGILAMDGEGLAVLILGMGSAAMSFLLVIHLVAYFSLVVRRGALLIAIAIWFFSGWILMPFYMITSMMAREPFVMLAVSAIIKLAFVGLIHFGILRRLEKVAAQ